MASEHTKEKNYTVSYSSGATGYGWEEKVNTLEEVKLTLGGIHKNYTAHVTVYSRKHNGFVYWKDCLQYNPRTNLIHI